MTDDRGQKTEDREQRSEVGSQNCARQARKDQGEKGKKLVNRHFIAFPAFLHALCSMLYAQNRNKK
jgi:hypothetical protein